ncbi:MlaD family protein [Nocardia higoensis]|uniref:MlaD family protein n=1 Tax=Nocardia higoensis TaxID=228599 RepID=UPI0002F4D668|nr:MlaD family protein [Nocardia higoensis]
MNPRSPLEFAARPLVTTVRAAHRRRNALSTAALIGVLLCGVAYLAFGALGVDPTAATMRVRVYLADSGGLLPGQNVALRGVPVGKVESVELTDEGLVAVAVVDAAARIPAGGTVRVASLSMAGEQYLDFRSDSDDGPYLADGDEIARERTSTPAPLWRTLAALDSTLDQVDPEQIATIVGELGVGPEGPDKLADIIDGGVFLISTLDSVLPQTVGLLRDSRAVLATVSELRYSEFSADADSFLSGVAAKSGGYVELLGAAPGTLRALDALLADNSAAGAELLDHLGVTAQMTSTRVPALQEFFFPTGRDGSTLDAIAVAFHDGGIWGLVNLYPRYACDYDLPRRPPSLPDFPEPYRYTYCPNTDPSVLIRGARNAPRPPGEEIPEGPPPGVSPESQTTRTPIGPLSIPLNFGGPQLPPPPPAPVR